MKSSFISSTAAARNSGTSRSEQPHTHTHTHSFPTVLIYAAFNVYFILYSCSLWIVFFGSEGVELVNTFNVFFIVAVLLL